MGAVLSRCGARSIDQLQAIQHLRAYTDASNLLYGLTIENAYKTRQILDGKVSVEEGKFKGMRTDHNILEMVRSYGIRFSEEEIDVLKTVTSATVTMGKYPIAKNARRQKDRSSGACSRVQPVFRCEFLVEVLQKGDRLGQQAVFRLAHVTVHPVEHPNGVDVPALPHGHAVALGFADILARRPRQARPQKPPNEGAGMTLKWLETSGGGRWLRAARGKDRGRRDRQA